MSHFIGLVFGNHIDSLLEPYDEGLRVKPYVELTKEEAIQKAKEDVEWILEHPNNPSIDVARSIKTDEQFYEFAQRFGVEKIDEDGNFLTTYNPDSKWDWWVVGGRWPDYLPTIHGQNFNSCTVGEVDWGKFFEDNPLGPFCFITEDGEWHETARMGWWGMTSDDKERSAWREELESYLKSVDPDTEITAIDFHI